MMMRKILLIVFGMVMFAAQCRVVDKEGEPMVGAAVFDCSGSPIGIVDKEGNMPKASVYQYPLVVRMLGFEPTIILEENSLPVVMEEKAMELAEVVVKDQDRPACRIVCYIHAVSSMTNGIDTVLVDTHCMADYLSATSVSTKGFKTWDEPRVLNAITYKRKASEKKTRQKTGEYSSSWARMDYVNPCLPDSFKGKTTGIEVKKSQKTGLEKVKYTLSTNQFAVVYDDLADYEGHVYTPGALKIIGMSMDFKELWRRDVYRYRADELYDIHDLVARTYAAKVLGRGKMIRSVFKDSDSNVNVDIYQYIEIYPVEITYLTKDEAKALKKEKNPTYPMTIPEAAKQ